MSTHGRFGLWTGLAVGVLMLGTLAMGVTHAQQQQQQRADRGGRMWQRDGGMMAMGPMAGLRFGLRQLGLTDQQKQQVRTIIDGHKADFQALSTRATPARRALMDAIAAGDESAIRQHSGEIAAVQTDRALLAAKVHGEIFKVLTPEQQQKAQSLRQQFEQRMTQRRGRGGAL